MGKLLPQRRVIVVACGLRTIAAGCIRPVRIPEVGSAKMCIRDSSCERERIIIKEKAKPFSLRIGLQR